MSASRRGRRGVDQLLADAYDIATGSLTTVLLGVAVLGLIVGRFLDITKPLGELLLAASTGGLTP